MYQDDPCVLDVANDRLDNRYQENRYQENLDYPETTVDAIPL